MDEGTRAGWAWWLAVRGRAGVRGGASIIVVSADAPLVVEDGERERERGVEACEAMAPTV